MFRNKVVYFLLFCSSWVNAQLISSTPFSAQGIGDIGFYGDAYFTGSAGIVASLVDSSQTNLFNPSAYSQVSQSLPLFAMGIGSQTSIYAQKDNQSIQNFTNLTHLSLVIPFAKRFGLAFGLKPFSRTGYEIYSNDYVAGDSIFYAYRGSGSIQEFNLGFAVSILKADNHTLSVGANGKHFFGQLINRRMAYLKNNQTLVGSFQDDYLNISSQGLDFGFTYKWRIGTAHQLTLGGIFRPELGLAGSREEVRVYFNNLGNVSGYDTLSHVLNSRGKIIVPQSLKVGFSYEFKVNNDTLKKRNKLPRFIFSGEYGSENWSAYSEFFDEAEVSFLPDFYNSSSIRLALEYTPHRFAYDKSAYIHFYDRLNYRMGVYQIDLPYHENNNQLSDVGMSFGVGVPFVLNRAVSSLNFSMNYGSRSSNWSDGIKEQYLGVCFGFNIAPTYDRWFRKYQLD